MVKYTDDDRAYGKLPRKKKKKLPKGQAQRKKEEVVKEQKLIALAAMNNIRELETNKAWNRRLLRMTGDTKRYGPGNYDLKIKPKGKRI